MSIIERLNKQLIKFHQEKNAQVEKKLCPGNHFICSPELFAQYGGKLYKGGYSFIVAFLSLNSSVLN